MFARQIIMKWFTFTVSLILVHSAWAQDPWSQDLKTAQSTAAQTGKDLLIYFSGPQGCQTCQQLEKQVLHTQAFLSVVQKDYVLVQIQAVDPNNDPADHLAVIKTFESQYGLKGAPTVFLADKDDHPYGKIDTPADNVSDFLDRLAFERRNKPLVDVGSTWIQDFETAKAKAAAQNKHLLLLFTGSDWCPYCITMEKQILGKPEFLKAIQKDFVLTKFDFPRYKKLPQNIQQQNERVQEDFAQHYGFQGYPTIYLALPDGTPYAQAGSANVAPKAYAGMLIDGRRQELKKEQAQNESSVSTSAL